MNHEANRIPANAAKCRCVARKRGGLEAYRRTHALLSADAITALRVQLSLTQTELAQLLQLDEDTVARWESGRNVQTGAVNVLLKLLRDVPDTLEYVRRQAA